MAAKDQIIAFHAIQLSGVLRGSSRCGASESSVGVVEAWFEISIFKKKCQIADLQMLVTHSRAVSFFGILGNLWFNFTRSYKLRICNIIIPVHWVYFNWKGILFIMYFCTFRGFLVANVKRRQTLQIVSLFYISCRSRIQWELAIKSAYCFSRALSVLFSASKFSSLFSFTLWT